VAALIILLSSVAGLLELAGLFLVVREIAADRRRAQELFPPAPQAPRRKRTYPPKLPSPGPDPYAQITRPRAGQLEQQVGRGFSMLANAMIDMRKAVDEQLDSSVAELIRRPRRGRLRFAATSDTCSLAVSASGSSE